MRLIPPSYVKPYVRRSKTDAADAQAICEGGWPAEHGLRAGGCHHASQPASPQVRLDGLCAALRAPPHRAGAHKACHATCGTIRLRLLKLGALVRVSVRGIKVAIASACPWQDEFVFAHLRLAIAAA